MELTEIRTELMQMVGEGADVSEIMVALHDVLEGYQDTLEGSGSYEELTMAMNLLKASTKSVIEAERIHQKSQVGE